jgi:primary-amine oxidase
MTKAKSRHLISVLLCVGLGFMSAAAQQKSVKPRQEAISALSAKVTAGSCLPATTTQYEPSRIIFQEFPARGPAETAWVVVWSENDHKGLWIEGAWFLRKKPFTLSNAIQVLGRAGLSNIFVPYHKLSSVANPRILDLESGGLLPAMPEDGGDCGVIAEPPLISPVDSTSRRVLIKEIRDRGVAWTSNGKIRRGEEMLLWATYDAGNYEYIIQYGFRDDGTITFRLGSTGYNSPIRPFEAHMHNALWYVDTNLGGPQNNSVMVMRHVEPGDPAVPCSASTTLETASDCMPKFNNGFEGFLDWNDKEFTHPNIMNTAIHNAQGKNISYDLMPMRSGTARHKEDYTQHDFWVTTTKSNETNYTKLSTYVNGESIENTDVALWYMSSNHHLPRDEDHEYAQPIFLQGVAQVMWSGFDLSPRNLFDDTPLHTPLCAAVPPNLVGWWPFDDDQTSVVPARKAGWTFDAPKFGTSQPSAVGTSTGPHRLAGVVNGSLQFDGINDYVQVPDSPSLNFGTGDFTIDAWVRSTQNSGVGALLDKRRGPPYQGYHLFTSDGTLFLQLATAGTFANYSSSAFIADGNWHHFAVIVNRTQDRVEWFVDGLAMPQNTNLLTGSLNNALPLRFGVRSFQLGGFWQGQLDELELFNRALDEIEVFTIFDAGSTGKCH